MDHRHPPASSLQPGLYLREAQLLGRKPITPEQAAANKAAQRRNRRPRKGTAGILPFSSATLWTKVKAGDFPAPVKLSAGVSAWRSEDVERWLREREAATNTGKQP